VKVCLHVVGRAGKLLRRSLHVIYRRMKQRPRMIMFCCVLLIPLQLWAADYPEEIPFVPTPMEVVDKMLALAEVKQGDVLYDLGSGDGRIVIRAAQKYGIRAVGIEMDRSLLAKAREDAKAAAVSHLVDFRDEDALKADISAATIVTLYMLPWFNDRMKPNFQKMLKPGARIVAHDFGIEGWQPDKTVKLAGYELRPGGYKHQHTLYLWRITNHF